MLGYLEHRFAYDPPFWDLYRLTPSGAEAIRALIASGETPWWTSPDLSLHFVRPLPSVLLAIDHAVFGHAALFWHAHSLLWYVALLMAASALFRRLLPRPTATLALLVFALSDANVFPFAWPSARYGLVGTTFAALGVLAHLRWRQDGWSPGRWLGPAALACGLLASEGALGGLAFAVAYEIVGPQEAAWRQRSLRASPFVAMALVYLAGYAAVGGGARASGAYISPLSEPAAFARAALTRLPVLLGDAVLGVPADLSLLGFEAALAAAGVLAVLLFAVLWRTCSPRAGLEERSTARWLGLGAVVAVAAGVGGLPGSRELLVANLGFAPVLAILIRTGLSSAGVGRAARLGVGLLALAHLGASPLGQLANEATMIATARGTEAAARDVERQAAGARRIVFVAASDPMASWYPQAVIAAGGGPAACWSWLCGTPADVTVVTTGPSSFTIETRGVAMLRAPFETLDRSPREPLREGDEVRTCGLRVRVEALRDGLPVRIAVTSDAELDAPGTAWLAWQGGAVRPLVLPRLGANTTVAWTPGPSGMF